jgi:hypothetical protein
LTDAGPDEIKLAAAVDGFKESAKSDLKFKESTKSELDKLLSSLEDIQEEEFNKDEEYKRLLTLAIDGKGHALSKVRLYFESLEQGFGAEALARIRDEPLESFSNTAKVLAVRTGTMRFSWMADVLEKKVIIDLGTWDTAAYPKHAIEHYAAALSSNSNMRSVLVNGVKLDFRDGWESKVLDWRQIVTVKALPATVATLLSNCTNLSSLDLRL